MPNKLMRLYYKQWLRSKALLISVHIGSPGLAGAATGPLSYAFRRKILNQYRVRETLPWQLLCSVFLNLCISERALNSLATCIDSPLLFLREVSLHMDIFKVSVAGNAVQMVVTQHISNMGNHMGKGQRWKLWVNVT